MVIGKNKVVLVNVYDPETSTIYHFYGCKWHSCLCLGSASDRYQDTLSMENQIQSLGHSVISVWKCKNPELTRTHLQKEFVPYTYFIMYAFEALLTPFQSTQMSHLMITSAHIPVSVVVNDHLTNEPTFLENGNPETLIQSFVEEVAC